VRAGTLLHDDGVHLWNVPLEGEPKLLWTHSRIRTYEITAAPGAHAVAFSVSTDPPPKRASDPSFFLYLLRSDGRIDLVDAVRGFGSIESPRFLRTSPDGPVTLYWIRSHEEVNPSTGRLRKQVMMLDGDIAREVRVPLRYGEAADQISSYSGSPIFTLATFLRDDLPTRLQILRSTVSAPSFWQQFGPVTSTDVFIGVAWITPREYVVPVAHRYYKKAYSLRLFRVGCEYYGSHVVYSGRAIDWGYEEAFWPLLPADRHHVLALGASDMQKIRTGAASSAPWLLVDVRSGKITPTDAQWERGIGWWASVQQDTRQGLPTTDHDAACGKFSWTYP
jgi:hypothetical protein